MRAIDQLPPQLRAWARIQLGNLALQGAAAGLLLLFLLGGAVAAKAAAAALSLLGAGSAALLVLGLAKVAEAIGSKSSAALDEAVSFFARWARESQASMSPDALAQKVGELTGKLESIPVFGKYVQLLDTVGANAISDAIFRGELVKLNAIADRLAELDPATRGALQQAVSSNPGAGDAILKAGPEGIDTLARRGRSRTLSTDSILNSEPKGLGESLDAWAERLSQVSPQEGAEILDSLKYSNEIRDTVRKPTGGAITARQNVGFTEKVNITIPNGTSVSSGRGGYIGISGQDPYVGTLPVPEQPIFQPVTVNGFRTNASDSEFKILNRIAKEIQDKMGVDNIRELPDNIRESITGDITLFTEREPCDGCAPLISVEWKNLLPNVKIKIVYGPRAEDISKKN